MEKKTLVKQLKASVNNDSLDYFDGIRLMVTWDSSAASHQIVLVSDGSVNFGGTGVKFVILSNGTINGETEYTIPTPAVGTVTLVATDATKPTEFVMFGMSNISKMYAYNSILAQGIYMHNPDRMKCLPNLTPYSNNLIVMFPYPQDGDCDISDYIASYSEKSSIVGFRCSIFEITPTSKILVSTDAVKEYTALTELGTNFFNIVTHGDTANLRNLVSLTNISIRNTDVFGNIADFAKCVALTRCNTNGTKISGSIESFVRGQFQNGRESASNVEFGVNPLITYNNGASVLDSRRYVSWSGTDIDHITITVNSSPV